MSDIIEWVLEMDVQAGQGDAVEPLVSELSAATKSDEPGALTYEYYISDDKSRVTVIERYTNNAAAMVHLGNFGAKFADRFLATFAPTRLVVYGPAEADLRAAVEGFGAVHMDYLVGFHR